MGNPFDDDNSFFDPADFSGSGASKRATKSQEEQNALEQKLKKEFAAQAREEIFELFPVAEANRNLGLQSGLDVLGQTVPQQFGAFQQGNIGAQEALLAGLGQQQNAIRGLPIDLSALQAQRIPVDTSFAQQQLPEFQTIGQAFAPPPTEQPQVPVNPATGLPFDLSSLLGGGLGGFGRF